jgi:uncharacterized membrane protein (UPF0127 family)
MLSTSTAVVLGKVPTGRDERSVAGTGAAARPGGPAALGSGARPRADWAIPRSFLLCDGVRVAPVTVASLPWELSVGLLGRDHVDGALLLETSFVIHTFGMRFPLDVAFCDRSLRVLEVRTMGRNRVARPRLRSAVVLEAAAGAFGAWRLAPGSRLRVEDDPADS